MDAVVSVEGLVKRYGQTEAVRDVSFSIAETEAFGYLGPNGAGKTTTIRCILGLIKPTAGSIRIHGHALPDDLNNALADVGYLPGEFALWPSMTGRECLDYLGNLHPHAPARASELLDRFELSAVELDRQIRLYSRGMKQKIGIVQAFQHEPKLVVLDEPTEGLDPMMKERFVDLLAEHRARGGAALLSSHILSEVERATDRVGVLKNGRLVRVGPTEDLTGDRVRHCTVVLKSEPSSLEALRLPGLSWTQQDGAARTLHFDYTGDMEPLVRALSSMHVEEFLAEPESLSEAFFDIFESEQA